MSNFLGTVTASFAIATIVTSPFLVTPLMPGPVGLGIATYAFGIITKLCMDNACYHLGNSQQQVIVGL